MAITPQTELKLLKVPILINNKNQITFSNAEAQYNYFNSLPKIEADNFTYQRHNSVIRYPAHIDDIIEYNYCMYQNENYSNKWFYAFITNMTYINDGMTEISISTDVFQTWQFDISWRQSFVEREMINVADDIPGANLIPEGLEIGEVKVSEKISVPELEAVCCVAFTGDILDGQGTVAPAISVNQNGNQYNGIPSAITFIICRFDALAFLLRVINLDGNGDKILDVFTVPKLAVESALPIDDPSVYPFTVLPVIFKENPITKTLNATPSQIDGYTPRNGKLRTYPYCYLGFNPQNGTKKIYRYEDFSNGVPSFKLMSEINHSPEVQIIPQNYRGASGDSLSDNASINGYPTLSYKTDVFNTWLAQNSQIISLNLQQENFNYAMGAFKTGIDMVGNAGNVAGGMAGKKVGAGDIASGYAGAVNQGTDLISQAVNHEFYIKQQMAQIEKQQLLPDNATMSSSNATLLGYGLFNQNVFTSYSIKRQFAERIDKYFDMYGYETNTLKIPNLNNRPNWNYVKTINANLVGNIPQNDLLTIRSFFDNGITLWHNPATYLDYSQNNR